MWITAILGGFPGFVLHTVNVKRLGLRQQFSVELAKNSVGFIALFGVVLADALPRLALFAIVLCLAGYFKVSQQEAFRAYMARGGVRGSSYKATLIGVGVTAAVFAVGVGAGSLMYSVSLERFEALLEADDFDAAERLAQRWLRTYPDDYAYLWNVARVKVSRDDLQGARTDLLDMLQFYPNDPDVLDWISDLDDAIADQADSYSSDAADGTIGGGAG